MTTKRHLPPPVTWGSVGQGKATPIAQAKSAARGLYAPPPVHWGATQMGAVPAKGIIRVIQGKAPTASAHLPLPTHKGAVKINPAQAKMTLTRIQSQPIWDELHFNANKSENAPKIGLTGLFPAKNGSKITNRSMDANWGKQGVGKRSMERAIQSARGGVALQTSLGTAHPQLGAIFPSPPPSQRTTVYPFPPTSVVQRTWAVNTTNNAFTYTPGQTPVPSYSFNALSAFEATQPIPHGHVSTLTSRGSHTGVALGDVASYVAVQYLEHTGDGFTGDHQPSGAAVKEALRQALHAAKTTVLTRQQAQNAYKKAITVVVSEVWHRLYSRTYGGRNNRAQINGDATNLLTASIEDFEPLALTLYTQDGWTVQDIQALWNALDEARQEFFKTGEVQIGTLS